MEIAIPTSAGYSPSPSANHFSNGTPRCRNYMNGCVKHSLRAALTLNQISLHYRKLALPISDSFSEFMKGAYRVFRVGRRYYRPIGEPPIESEEKTTHNINETIDVSVFNRWRNDPDYRPKNLSDWAKRHSIDIASLRSSVTADDPTIVAPD